MTELENIQKQLALVGELIKAKEEELQVAVDRWDDWRAANLRFEIGRDRQLWTALEGRRRQLTSVDEAPSRGSSQTSAEVRSELCPGSWGRYGGLVSLAAGAGCEDPDHGDPLYDSSRDYFDALR